MVKHQIPSPVLFALDLLCLNFWSPHSSKHLKNVLENRMTFKFCFGNLKIKICSLMWVFLFYCFSRWHSGRESARQCRKCQRCRFDLRVGKISWSRKWQPTPVFLPGKFHRQRSLAGYKRCQTWLSEHTHVILIFIKLQPTDENFVNGRQPWLSIRGWKARFINNHAVLMHQECMFTLKIYNRIFSLLGLSVSSLPAVHFLFLLLNHCLCLPLLVAIWSFRSLFITLYKVIFSNDNGSN